MIISPASISILPTPAPIFTVMPSRSSKVRMAMIGLKWGAFIAEEIASSANPFVEIVSVCDTDLTRAKEVSHKLGLTYAPWNDLLDDPSIEAIALFTGPVGRAKLIQQAIRAGKDVITTKPLETDIAASRAVLEEAAQLGRVVHLNSPNPVPAGDIHQILSWQREFHLGTPLAMRAETWASYREKADGSWYDDTSICSAAPLIRLGIYFFNEFAELLGQPEAVHTMHSRLRTQRPTADHAQVSIRYQNGALANIFASFCVNDGHPYHDLVTLNYENGTIRRWVERPSNKSGSFHRGVIELQLPDSNHSLLVKTKPGQWCGWYQWDAFYTAVRQRELTDAISIDQMLFGVRLLEAMNRSARSGLSEAVI